MIFLEKSSRLFRVQENHFIHMGRLVREEKGGKNRCGIGL